MRTSGARRLAGVGLGLRYAFLDELAERLRAGEEIGLSFVEVCPENYMRRGGGVPAALACVMEHLPALTHGLTFSFGNTGELGEQSVERAYLDALKPFLAKVGAPFHSDHLCLGAHQGGYSHDLLPIPWTSEVVRHTARRIQAARELLDVPIAIENISYYLMPGTQELDEGSFLRAVLEEADASLLLDVNNVFVNAKNFNRDPRALIDALPLERVVELHVAGHRHVPWADRIIDNHGAPVDPAVLDLLAYTLAKTGPVPVLLERDVSIPPLDELLLEVAQVREVYDRAIGGFARALQSSALPLHRRVYEPREPFEPTPNLDAIASTMLGAITGQLATAGASLAVYRRLVRSGIREAIRVQMSRAATLRGAQFASDVDAYIDGGLPRSPFLRDVPRLFLGFVASRWQADASAPRFLCELADHEVTEFELSAAEDAPNGAPLADAALEISKPVRLTIASRLARYAHPVHEAADGQTEIAPRATNLLSYRDRDHAVRVLSLTDVAARIFEGLVTGLALGDAIRLAASEGAVSLTPEVVAEVSQFLADLAERGVLLGPFEGEPDRMALA